MTTSRRGTAAVLVLLLAAGCGNGTSATSAGTPETAPETAPETSPGTAPETSPATSPGPSRSSDPAEAAWSTPSTGDEAVEVFARMPARLGTWRRIKGYRGSAYYRHPDGSLGVEAGEIRDLYAEPLAAAEAIRRITQDLRPGHVDCSSPPFRCVQGTFDGESQMVWSEDGSEVVLVVTWPDDEAKERLRRAWQAAARDPG